MLVVNNKLIRHGVLMCLQRIKSYCHGKAPVIIYFKILAYILDVNEYHIQAQYIKALALFLCKISHFLAKNLLCCRIFAKFVKILRHDNRAGDYVILFCPQKLYGMVKGQ